MEESALSASVLVTVRAVIGLVQGLALYLIYLSYDGKNWPATDPFVFTPLLLVALLVPLCLLQALGGMRLRTLALWGGIATLLIAGFGFYDIWRAAPDLGVSGPVSTKNLPSWQVVSALIVMLFIAQSLIAGGDAERKWIASYPTHYDEAWKLAVQLALSVAFVGAFWLVLWLGAGLFKLIKIDEFATLLQHEWFAIPATALATAAAIHVTDVRANLVRGIRTVGLTLLSWLLPLMALIVTGFLVALAFTGVQPLWATRFAAGLLLIATGGLVILVNAAYQDGDAERTAPRILRYAATLASLVLVPLTALAGNALLLRIAQYGWTADRIYMFAALLIGGCYAAGYAAAALWRGAWFKRIERWNFYTALFILTVLFALFTPIADPYRIAVASQMARLESGRVTADKFDFANLRWEGGRFGHAALQKLKVTTSLPNAGVIRENADAALKQTNRYAASQRTTPTMLSDNIVPHTADGKLPESFMHQDWRINPTQTNLPPCLTLVRQKCDAWMMDLRSNGSSALLIVYGTEVYAFQADQSGTWQLAATWALRCAPAIDAMRAGQFKAVPPASPLPDLEVAGQRIPASPPAHQTACP
jgi:hypothetical protein